MILKTLYILLGLVIGGILTGLIPTIMNIFFNSETQYYFESSFIVIQPLFILTLIALITVIAYYRSNYKSKSVPILDTTNDIRLRLENLINDNSDAILTDALDIYYGSMGIQESNYYYMQRFLNLLCHIKAEIYSYEKKPENNKNTNISLKLTSWINELRDQITKAQNANNNENVFELPISERTVFAEIYRYLDASDTDGLRLKLTELAGLIHGTYESKYSEMDRLRKSRFWVGIIVGVMVSILCTAFNYMVPPHLEQEKPNKPKISSPASESPTSKSLTSSQ